MKKIIEYFRNNKHRLATIALIVGFLVDLITFRTINLSLALTILSVHLFIVAASLYILAPPQEEDEVGIFKHIRTWLPVLQQYSMGNLLSAFLVLYSASGSLAQSWPFLVLVAIAIIGNETLKSQKNRLPFQTALLFLNIILFFALFVPIVLNDIGVASFVISAVVAVVLFSIYTHIGRYVVGGTFKQNWLSIRFGWVGVAVLIILFYFTNIIPPIPLSLKSADVYYNVTRINGDYVVEEERRNALERFFDIDGHTLKLVAGSDAYVFTSVFAPADFSENVVHRWQFFNEETNTWETQNTVRFPIAGGRNGGYRGFSLTENPEPGKWRVSIETVRGQVIGRTALTIERVLEPPETNLQTR